LGDVICTLPVLAAIRSYLPQSRLEVVGSLSVLELLKESGYADAVRSFDWAPFAGLYSEKQRERKVLKDFLIDFDYIIVYVGNEIFLRNLQEIVSCPVVSAHPRRIPPKTHIVDHLLTPLTDLGYPIKDRIPYLQLSARRRKAAREFLNRRFPKRGGSPLIGIHPGSGGRKKIWPYWKDFIMRLMKEKDILIFSGPAEEEKIDDWKEIRCLDRNLVENPPLPLMGALLGNCDLYLGNDSGVTHLAAAMASRTIALFGPSDPDTWRPRGNTILIKPSLNCAPCVDDFSCPHFRCLKNFHPDTLWDMVQSELKANNSHNGEVNK
jgi:ADP-heptose:LPS heptosyltransferase